MQENKDRKRSTSKQIIARVSFKCFYDRAVFYVIAWRKTHTHTYTHIHTYIYTHRLIPMYTAQ